jgi:hypothetical protein
MGHPLQLTRMQKEKWGMAMIELESMAIAMPEVVGHPNREAFCGVLTLVDVPSQRSPSGARGHQVVLTRAAAEAALPSLLGMALDYAPSYDRHDVQRKVGVITQAEVLGHTLEIGGYLFARDFPEVVKKIAAGGRREGRAKLSSLLRSTAVGAKAVRTGTVHAGNIFGMVDASGRKNLSSEEAGSKGPLSTLANRLLRLTIALRGGLPDRQGENADAAGASPAESLPAETLQAEDAELGMSYEVTGVELVNARARVWTLTKVIFTGAAILRRDKAAYQDTWIELGS